jgi:hypothetical protein
MAKKRLSALAKEYGVTFEYIHGIVLNNLEEEMVTGKGKNIWISAEGQTVLENLIPMMSIHRGIVIRQAPNPRFVLVKTQDSYKMFKVEIPLALSGKLTSKVIYFESDNVGDNPKYKWIKPTLRS